MPLKTHRTAGRILIETAEQGNQVIFRVTDHGTGLTPEAQKRIWDGFFTPRDTLQYSSRKPFDFGAGGKGADLLRMKIFSEQYGFDIQMKSKRCRHLPEDSDLCPGHAARCPHHEADTCDGRTEVMIRFDKYSPGSKK